MKYFFSTLIILVSIQFGYAQKAKYQSIFIYNFSKYVKWPDHVRDDGFIIGVLGNTDIQKSLEEMAAMKKSSQGLSITIEKYNTLADIKTCHILVVADNRLSLLSDLAGLNALKNTLIITDEPGMAKKGAIINFVEQSGKIRFELNSIEANKKDLKVSTSLSSLAILIN